MAQIKSMSNIAQKWVQRASTASDLYKQGVQSPRRSWQDASVAANDTYVTAVTQAAQAGRFGAGVQRAGEAKWQQGATQKGPNRFTQGVQIGQPAYDKGFTPYHETIANTTLPQRYARGDPRNYDRVNAIGQALHQRRQQELGG